LSFITIQLRNYAKKPSNLIFDGFFDSIYTLILSLMANQQLKKMIEFYFDK
jgi:hypothetical protein